MPTLRLMRSVPLVVALLAAVIAPASAFAGSVATAPANRSFEITGLVLGDQKIDAQGKIALQGDQLMASVGCNAIGGTVSVDGDVVTIAEPLVMTEMACPGVSGDMEAALIKVLQHGPFRITDGTWAGDGAQILVKELDIPAPPQSRPPDEPVGSSPGAIIVEPVVSCPPVPIDPGFGGGSGSGSGGSTGTGGGSTGSGGGATGSGGTSGNVGSGTTEPGQNPTGTAIAEPAGTAIPEPAGVPPATPAVEPGGTADPAASDNPEAVPPAPPEPGQTFGLDQGPEPSFIVEPQPSVVIVPDPGAGTLPIDLDPCERYLASDVTSGAGAGAAIPPEADAAAEHDKATSNASAMVGASAILALVGLLAVLAMATVTIRRWRATRRGTEADASR